jgi:hypothetical protein
MDASQRTTMEGLVARLGSLVERLGSFSLGSEEVFLRTGQKVMVLEKRALDLIDCATKAVSGDASTGAGGARMTQLLELELGRLDRHLVDSVRKTKQGIEVLSSITTGIGSLEGFRDTFDMITMTLRSLASSTRIENTRMAVRGAGFETVASDVRHLADEVTPKFENVLAQGALARKEAERSIAQTRRFLDEQSRTVTGLRQSARTSLQSLTRMVNATEQLVTTSAGRAHGLHSDLARVQVALQSHDISRQILDHVDAEVRALIGDANKALAGQDARFADWMAELRDACRLQEAHVRSAREKLALALRQISESFGAMVGLVDAFAEETQRLAGSASGHSLIDEVERTIGCLTTELRQNTSNEREMLDTLSRVTQSVAGMEASANEVAGMGNDAKVIGLNAMVKASNAGRDGFTLTTLARAIQDTSEAIETSSAAVSKSMRDLVGAAGKLFNHDRAGGQVESRPVSEQIIAELERLVLSLRTYHDSITSALASLRTGAMGMLDDVQSTAEQLQAMMDKTNTLSQLECDLAAQAAQAEPHAASSLQRQPVRAATMTTRYTMSAERKTHDDTMSETRLEDEPSSVDAESPGGSIEFF